MPYHEHPYRFRANADERKGPLTPALCLCEGERENRRQSFRQPEAGPRFMVPMHVRRRKGAFQKTKPMILWCVLSLAFSLRAQDSLDAQLPVRGFCIAAPGSTNLHEFIRFVEKELALRGVNTLILRVDYNFQFSSHPELADKSGLSKAAVSKLMTVCRKHHI